MVNRSYQKQVMLKLKKKRKKRKEEKELSRTSSCLQRRGWSQNCGRQSPTGPWTSCAWRQGRAPGVMGSQLKGPPLPAWYGLQKTVAVELKECDLLCKVMINGTKEPVHWVLLKSEANGWVCGSSVEGCLGCLHPTSGDLHPVQHPANVHLDRWHMRLAARETEMDLVAPVPGLTYLWGVS